MAIATNDVIAHAREILQDEREPYRLDDASIARYITQALKRIAVLRPDLFTVVESFTTVERGPAQKLPNGAIRLVDVHYVGSKESPQASINEISMEQLRRTHRDWAVGDESTPKHFIRNPRNPERFFLSPPPSPSTVLTIEYAKSPGAVSAGGSFDYPSEAYFSVVVDATVYVAESINDRAVASGRATLFYESFTQALGLNLRSREVTDTTSGGVGGVIDIDISNKQTGIQN